MVALARGAAALTAVGLVLLLALTDRSAPTYVSFIAALVSIGFFLVTAEIARLSCRARGR